MPTESSSASYPLIEPELLSLDKLFKTIIQVFFKDLVEMLHPELAEVLNFEKVVFIAEPAFADFRKQGQVEPDIVAQLETRVGNSHLAIVHIESEARFSSAMEKRMRRYQLQLELKYDLPIIAAVVFLKGGPPGVVAREAVQEVGPWKCGSSRYLSFGLSGSLAEEWVARPQRLAAALAAMMGSKVWDPVEKKLTCLRTITFEENDDRRFLLNKVIDECLQLKEDERARFEAALDSEVEVKTMVVTWKEALAESEARGIALGEARGEARGFALGEERGEERGKVEATRNAIELVAHRRFGKVPATVTEQLAAISELSLLHDLLEVLAGNPTLSQFEAALSGSPDPGSLPS